jgi:nucleoside diphosphate kinase
MNEALVLIKPHAAEWVAYVLAVEDALEPFNVVKQGEFTGKEIRERGLIHKHYGTLASRANLEVPAHWGLDCDVFGENWKTIVDQGRAVNQARARKDFYPFLNTKEFTKLWRACPNMKLAPGTYVAKMGDHYVVNGFYDEMVESWETDDAIVRYYVIRWDHMSWRKFRQDVIGCTDPAKAPRSSLRGFCHRCFNGNIPHNGVHASAGPLEAIDECKLWLDYTPPFTSELFVGATEYYNETEDMDVPDAIKWKLTKV